MAPFWVLLACVLLPAASDSKRAARDDGDSACESSDAACADVGGFAAIELMPNPVIFGDVGAAAQQTFTIRSVGSANLEVPAIEVDEGTDWFRIDVEGVVGTYVPGAHVDVPATYFSPGVNVTGRVVVLSNDVANPTALVDLLGGTTAPRPSP